MNRLAASIPLGAVIAAGLMVMAALAAPADDKAAAVERGRVLVADRCALCHATGARGESPKPTAPPLRRLAERYPDAALTEAFEKGLLERHPAMPPFRFSRDDLTAILAYLHSIHEVRGA